ncbi:MAG: T9SS C-terminal target domain-containing protein, partial [Bacteroidales bacterium]|nr:T9SS C-terminal target domain-containing protein [Bacteroidales bacterium]
MQKGTIKVLITLFTSLWITGLSAQNSINTSGGNASSTDGNMSYSVGQVFYNTSQGTNGSIIEGVQQPYEI